VQEGLSPRITSYDLIWTVLKRTLRWWVSIFDVVDDSIATIVPRDAECLSFILGSLSVPGHRLSSRGSSCMVTHIAREKEMHEVIELGSKEWLRTNAD